MKTTMEKMFCKVPSENTSYIGQTETGFMLDLIEKVLKKRPFGHMDVFLGDTFEEKLG